MYVTFGALVSWFALLILAPVCLKEVTLSVTIFITSIPRSQVWREVALFGGTLSLAVGPVSSLRGF